MMKSQTICYIIIVILLLVILRLATNKGKLMEEQEYYDSSCSAKDCQQYDSNGNCIRCAK
jgi:hypothetical protein